VQRTNLREFARGIGSFVNGLLKSFWILRRNWSIEHPELR